MDAKIAWMLLAGSVAVYVILMVDGVLFVLREMEARRASHLGKGNETQRDRGAASNSRRVSANERPENGRWK